MRSAWRVLRNTACAKGVCWRLAVGQGSCWMRHWRRALGRCTVSSQAAPPSPWHHRAWGRPLSATSCVPGLFTAEQFDVVCLFHMIDLVPDPGALLDECRRVLKPGGLILCINNNVQAVSARLLKERSPIVEIKHVFLFGPATMERIFTASRVHDLPHYINSKQIQPALPGAYGSAAVRAEADPTWRAGPSPDGAHVDVIPVRKYGTGRAEARGT